MQAGIQVIAFRGVRSVRAYINPTAPPGTKLTGGGRLAFEDIQHLLTDWPIRCQEPVRRPEEGPRHENGHPPGP